MAIQIGTSSLLEVSILLSLLADVAGLAEKLRSMFAAGEKPSEDCPREAFCCFLDML